MLAAGLTLGAGRWVQSGLAAPGPAGSGPVLVGVPAGASTREVAELLAQQHLIKDATLFRYYARLTGQDSRIQGGQYELSAAMTPAQILDKLAHGEVVVHRFTVPEGLTVEQVADLLAAKGLVDRQRFLTVAAGSHYADPWLPKTNRPAQPLEGYLFPATYDYEPGATPEQLLSMMVDRFASAWTPERAKRAQELGMTAHQALTLASIVEKETSVATERAAVAGVYMNRLKIGMKLDADPTVRYALDKPAEEPLLYKDLDVASPYNTYRRAGLPPGPIAAPGDASIQAVLYPAAHDYLYFVAKEDGTGEHYFARTLAEQTQNTTRAEANAKAQK